MEKNLVSVLPATITQRLHKISILAAARHVVTHPSFQTHLHTKHNVPTVPSTCMLIQIELNVNANHHLYTIRILSLAFAELVTGMSRA